MVGTAVLGQIFDRVGWLATVAGIGLIIVFAMGLAFRLRAP